MKVKGRIRLLILGVQHIILATPGEKWAGQELFEPTMMRRLPKFGCGVVVGIWTTLVAGAEAILKEWDSAREL